MIDPQNPCAASIRSALVGFVGPLAGVLVGSVSTWLVQRNEWGRQRRWELKRDATLDTLRALADLEDAVTKLDSVLRQPPGVLSDEARTAQQTSRRDARALLDKCCSAYTRAQIVADLTVGGEFSKELSNYFQFAIPLVLTGLNHGQNFLEGSETRKNLALRSNAVVMSAREALEIKDAGDLPLPAENL